MKSDKSDDAFVCRCVSDMLNGLSDGLSHFSGLSQVAVIYCVSKNSPMMICDPQNLLQEHRPRIKRMLIDDCFWKSVDASELEQARVSRVFSVQDLELTGIIEYGGQSGAVYYQAWFTKQHSDLCSIGPVRRWLEHAVWCFSHDIANGEEMYTGISGAFLRGYSLHAVRDHIVDEMNIYLGWDSQIRVYPLLDAVLAVSNTPEEGAWPVGELVFVDPQLLGEVRFVARFLWDECPQLKNSKHVRKLLLTVEHSDYKLISDGKAILGISENVLPDFVIQADFHGRHGFMKINDTRICSFSEGSFSSSTRCAQLVEVEEALLGFAISSQVKNTLFQIVTRLAHHAQSQRHGCTLVLDLNPQPVIMSGQKLDSPLDLRQPDLLKLSTALTRVDGALHIGADQHLHGFACLLDGRSIPAEDRGRGARYNSALRFTAEHKNIIVVVVSSDRPASVIREGVALSSICHWYPESGCVFSSDNLQEWCAKS